jgi:diguanylate cyclase (GGDEF)-like protein
MRLTRRQPSQISFVVMKRPLARGSSCALIVAALSAVFLLDRISGSAPVQHLYYLPIIFAGIRFGYRGSLAAATAAIVLYHLANPHILTFRYEESDVVQMALFIAVGVTSAKLSNDRRRLRALALTDDLTGLHNLRSFEAQLEQMLRRAREAGAALSLLVLDLDRLKSLNDRHGHLAGAEAVRTVGHIIGTRLPAETVACRYGGDEFVVALPNCGTDQALTVANHLRDAVSACAPVLAGISFRAGTLSISVGVTSRTFHAVASDTADVNDDVDDGEQLFRAADAALYDAKNSGRNRVAIHSPSAL